MLDQVDIDEIYAFWCGGTKVLTKHKYHIETLPQYWKEGIGLNKERQQ